MCVALPARIITLLDGATPSRPAIVEMGEARQHVDLVMTPEAQPGDFVIVHSGFALRVVPEEQALNARRMLGVAQPPQSETPLPIAAAANDAIDV